MPGPVPDGDKTDRMKQCHERLHPDFIHLVRKAREDGELPASADPVVLAQLASATIHTIAIRARALVPRKELEAIVKGAIDVMCATAPENVRSR